MAEEGIVELVGVCLHRGLVAQAHCNPVGGTFPDQKLHLNWFGAFLIDARLQEPKMIIIRFDRLDHRI